jgi:phage terminase small subunit
MPLRKKRQRFVEEYLLDLNAAQAAIRAGYSEKTARTIGQHLLTKIDVQAAIEARQKALQETIAVTQETVIKELARIGFANMHHYATWGQQGISLKDSQHLTYEQGAVIAEVSESRDGRVRFKLHSKPEALDKLCRHLGLYDADKSQAPETHIHMHVETARAKVHRKLATMTDRYQQSEALNGHSTPLSD